MIPKYFTSLGGSIGKFFKGNRNWFLLILRVKQETSSPINRRFLLPASLKNKDNGTQDTGLGDSSSDFIKSRLNIIIHQT